MSSYSNWELETMKKNKLEPDTVGTLMKLQSLKESNYMSYYYGDLAFIIVKRNLIFLNKRDYKDDEVFEIVNKKANYYKEFKNQNLKTDILKESEITKINYDITRIIKATIVTKSNDDQAVNNSNALAKGDYSCVAHLHKAFKLINRLAKIKSPEFLEEVKKLDAYYEQRIKEIEDLEEYHRIIAKEWKNSLIN